MTAMAMPLRAGDFVRISYPVMPYHGKQARVTEVMGRVQLNGLDLGEMAAVRLNDGVEIALPLTTMRVVTRRADDAQPMLPGVAA